MSIAPVIQLVKDDPELMHRLLDAGSREERAAILTDLGVAMPDRQQLKATLTDLMAVTGGGAAAKVFGIQIGSDVALGAAGAAA